MKLSVVTVAYKNSKIILDLLNSIDKFNDMGNEIEIIVVDNSPEDERIETDLKKSHFNNYLYIPSENRGFGAGNNVGTKYAKGEIIAFLNPDIVLVEPIFRTICAMFQRNPNLHLMGVKLLDINGKQNSSFGYLPEYICLGDQLLIKFRHMLGIFNQQKMYIQGADFFIRKSCFEKIGGFDENIFMYCEEADITHRINKNFPSGQIIYYPKCHLIHLEKQSSEPEKVFERDLKSKKYYFAKYQLDFKKLLSVQYTKEKIKCVLFRLLDSRKFSAQKKRMSVIEKYLSDIGGQG